MEIIVHGCFEFLYVLHVEAWLPFFQTIFTRIFVCGIALNDRNILLEQGVSVLKTLDHRDSVFLWIKRQACSWVRHNKHNVYLCCHGRYSYCILLTIQVVYAWNSFPGMQLIACASIIGSTLLPSVRVEAWGISTSTDPLATAICCELISFLLFWPRSLCLLSASKAGSLVSLHVRQNCTLFTLHS